MSKQKSFSLFLSIICFIVISFGMIMPVSAATYWCDACGENHNTDGMSLFVIEMADQATNINFFKEDPGSGIGLTALLRFDIDNNDVFKSLWYGNGTTISVQAIFDAVTPIASVLTVIYLLLEISERVFSEQYSAEQLIISFIRWGLVLLIILNVAV